MAVPEITQVVALALAETGVAGEGQGLGVQVDGLPVVPQIVVAGPEMAQGDALALAVAGVAGDGQGLSVQVDGLPVVAQDFMTMSQAAQMRTIQGGVSDLPRDATAQLNQCAVV